MQCAATVEPRGQPVHVAWELRKLVDDLLVGEGTRTVAGGGNAAAFLLFLDVSVLASWAES